MNAWVGTSGWSYKEWKGSFYPDDISSDGMLAYYAGRLNAVEVNNTFYRMPKKDVLRGWAEQVTGEFRFVLKASRRITHQAKLGEEAADPLEFLLGNVGELGDRLGPMLFQTPPWLKKDAGRLQAFLAMLPEGFRAAFEFRSTSWFDDEVYDLLRARNVALAVADTGDEETDPPLVPTADYGYARLRREAYPDDLLEEWARRLSEPEWSDVHVFFKHEDEATGPRLAERFRGLLG